MDIMTLVRVEAFHFKDDGKVPNSTLPVVIMRKMLYDIPKVSEAQEQLDAIVKKNDWYAAWTAGIYRFVHYHSTAHEALAAVAGEAYVTVGGGSGKEILIGKGDVLYIPAGVGHKRATATEDFRVVGMYPIGQTYDLLRSGMPNRKIALENLPKVTMPQYDPLQGAGGMLKRFWK